MHPGAQASGVPFGNTGDQVGGSSQSERGRESADDCNDLPFQSKRLQGFVNRSLFETLLPRDADVSAGRITGASDLAFAQRVPHSHDANKTVPEQCLRTNFRTSRLLHYASFQIDRPVAKGRAVLIWLLHEAQPHGWSFPGDASDETGSEVFYEALAGPQRECSDQPLEVEIPGRAKNRFSVLHELPDPLAQLKRSGGGWERDRVRPGPIADRPKSHAIAPAPGSSLTG